MHNTNTYKGQIIFILLLHKTKRGGTNLHTYKRTTRANYIKKRKKGKESVQKCDMWTMVLS